MPINLRRMRATRTRVLFCSVNNATAQQQQSVRKERNAFAKCTRIKCHWRIQFNRMKRFLGRWRNKEENYQPFDTDKIFTCLTNRIYDITIVIHLTIRQLNVRIKWIGNGNIVRQIYQINKIFIRRVKGENQTQLHTLTHSHIYNCLLFRTVEFIGPIDETMHHFPFSSHSREFQNHAQKMKGRKLYIF